MRVETAGRTPIKLWTTSPQGDVPVEERALAQLRNIASLPFVFRHVAAMPDVHLGMGATVGSVIATRGAIVPAAVGVDIGCGMEAKCAFASAASPSKPFLRSTGAVYANTRTDRVEPIIPAPAAAPSPPPRRDPQRRSPGV